MALRLCEDDNQWRDCLDEAREYARPRQIRNLFCKILVNCFPAKPKELYLRYEECMKEDFQYKRRNDTLAQGHTMDMLVKNDLLIALNNFFKDNDYTNESFGIDMPDSTLVREIADTGTEVDPDAESFFEENIGKLNEGQKAIYDKIVGIIDSDGEGLINTDAPGGTGKTFLAEVILSYIRKSGDVAVACAHHGLSDPILCKNRADRFRYDRLRRMYAEKRRARKLKTRNPIYTVVSAHDKIFSARKS